MNLFSYLASRPLGRAAAVVAALAAVLCGAGVAWAYWSSGGTGTGNASAGDMTINVTALQGGDNNQSAMLPGTSADVVLRVDNPNSFAVQVTSIASNGAAVASNGCTPTGVTFSSPTDYSPAQFTLAPGSNLIRLGGAASMSTSSSSACQGATFSIPVSVTVQR